MNQKQIKFITKTLGSDFLSGLQKSELTGGIVKLNTNTATDINEIRIGLQIVPRTVLAYLFMHLKSKEIGAVIDLDLPFADNTTLHLNKFTADNYSGEIIQKGKKISEFRYRSIPGVGLILMSTLELYDINQLNEIKTQMADKGVEEKENKLQNLIEEKLHLHALVSNVIDQKLSQRDAIKQLIEAKLNQSLVDANEPEEAEGPGQTIEIEVPDKKSKLRAFMEKREGNKVRIIDKLQKAEIKCPDCRTTLYSGKDSIKLCVCYGEHRSKEIKIQKSENGRIKLQFPKELEIEGIEMILDTIKNK